VRLHIGLRGRWPQGQGHVDCIILVHICNIVLTEGLGHSQGRLRGHLGGQPRGRVWLCPVVILFILVIIFFILVKHVINDYSIVPKLVFEFSRSFLQLNVCCW
jgi:hypothetical protein